MSFFNKIINKLFVVFLFIFFNKIAYSNQNPLLEWETHSEDIEILSIDEIYEIVNSKKAIFVDSWKKNKTPDALNKKKWFPPKRYSIPGAIWMPNIGRETLTVDTREYLQNGLKKITKNNKDEKLIFFCRRGYYSKIAAERAIKLGYKNISLFPGTDLWEDAGYQLVVINPLNLN